MPFIIATEQRKPVTGNEYEDTLNALGATHFWKFDETAVKKNDATERFTDDIGSRDLQLSGGSATGEQGQFAMVGPFRGEPRVQVMCFEQSANARNASSEDPPLQNSTGAIGGFFALSFPTNSGSDWNLMSEIYDNNASLGWWFMVEQDGTVNFHIGLGSPSARWRWTSTAVRNAFKRDPTDTNLSGNKWAFIAIVQRGDGAGPKLVVNDTEYAYDSKINGFQAISDDSWFDDTYTTWGTPGSGYSSEFRVSDNRNFSGYINNAYLKVSGLFVFEGSPPSTSEMLDLFNAANTDGPATDYCEYVRGIEPFIWQSFNGPGPETAQFGNDTLGHWCPNILDQAAFGTTKWFGIRSSASTASRVDMPTEFSGVAYQKKGIQFASGTWFGEGAYDFNQASTITNANGFTSGSICLLVELNGGSGTQLLFSLRGGSGSNVRGFDVGWDGTAQKIFLEVFTDAFKNNSYRIELDRPAADGTPFMLMFVNNGVDVTTYVNGVEQDGDNITTNLNGTFDGSEWIGEPGSTGQMSPWHTGAKGGSNSQNRYIGILYDVFVTLHEFSNSEQKDLYDLLTGTISQATIP